MRENESFQEANERYFKACHAMQSGVAFTAQMEGGKSVEQTSKHLRVGVNSALVCNGALAQLLINKGIITAEEHATAQADAMEAEAARYQKEISEKLGREVILG